MRFKHGAHWGQFMISTRRRFASFKNQTGRRGELLSAHRTSFAQQIMGHDTADTHGAAQSIAVGIAVLGPRSMGQYEGVRS
ncbi:MAG: hypothetical protein K2Y42_13450 [Hyphomicrobium sp.]|nr:hypothetical protein [Hyphomicrobium sp.]